LYEKKKQKTIFSFQIMPNLSFAEGFRKSTHHSSNILSAVLP